MKNQPKVFLTEVFGPSRVMDICAFVPWMSTMMCLVSKVSRALIGAYAPGCLRKRAPDVCRDIRPGVASLGLRVECFPSLMLLLNSLLATLWSDLIFMFERIGPITCCSWCHKHWQSLCLEPSSFRFSCLLRFGRYQWPLFGRDVYACFVEPHVSQQNVFVHC